MKTKKKKARNSPDLTLRNLHALKKRIEIIEDWIKTVNTAELAVWRWRGTAKRVKK